MQALQFVYLFLCSILLVASRIKYYGTFEFGTNAIVSSFDFKNDHFLALSKDLSTSKYYFVFSNLTTYTGTYKELTGGSPFTQVRTFTGNIAYTNSIYLIFDRFRISTVRFPGNSKTNIFEKPGISVENSCFIESTQEIAAIISNNTHFANYRLVIIKDGNVEWETDLDVSSYYAHDKMIYENKMLYVSFQTQIQIFELFDSKFVLKKTISFSSSEIEAIDISVNGTKFCYSINNTFTILSTDDLNTPYWTYTCYKQIDSIVIMKYNLCVLTNYETHMYDHQIKELIDIETSPFSTLGHSVSLFPLSNHIVIGVNAPAYSSGIMVLALHTNYECESCTNDSDCRPSYLFDVNKSICMKQDGYIPPIVEEEETEETIIEEETVEEPTVIENETEVEPQIPEPEVEIQEPVHSKENYFKISEGMLEEIEFYAGRIMSFSSYRISPNFLISFTGFLDDLWFYKYHRHNYTDPIVFFTTEVDIVNELRLSAWVFEFLDWINAEKICLEENEEMYNYLVFEGNDPESIYFLNSTETVYKSNFITNLFFFSIFRLVLFLLTKIRKNLKQENKTNPAEKINNNKQVSAFSSFLKAIIKSLSEGSRFWTLIVGMIEVNMVKLSFSCFIQFKLFSSFDFMNKLNLIVTTVFLFSIVFYCLCFYLLILNWERKFYSKILLTKSVIKQNSFYFESTFIVIRGLLRSFLHAFLIENYNLQIVLLAVSDLFFLIICIKMFSCFENKFIGVLAVIYTLSFLLFDIFFSVKANVFTETVVNMDETSYSLVLILALIFNAVLMSIVLFICTLKDIIVGVVSQCCKKNQIAHDHDINRLSTRESSRQFSKIKSFNQIKTQQSILKTKLTEIENAKFMVSSKNIFSNKNINRESKRIPSHKVSSKVSYKDMNRENYLSTKEANKSKTDMLKPTNKENKEITIFSTKDFKVTTARRKRGNLKTECHFNTVLSVVNQKEEFEWTEEGEKVPKTIHKSMRQLSLS